MKDTLNRAATTFHLHWAEADRLRSEQVSTVTMSSWMKARVFSLFCFIQAFSFTTEAAETTQQDSCTRGIKTLTAKMDKLQADIKAIAHGLGLLDPSGTVFSNFVLSELIHESWQNRKQEFSALFALLSSM